MVIDTSALLALLFKEPAGEWVREQVMAPSSAVRMSTVNLAEALIVVRDRFPRRAIAMERRILRSGVDFVPPSVEHASIAAAARLMFPLNLGDCFAYALAMTTGEPLLTLDTDFRHTDVQCMFPPDFGALSVV